MTVRRRRSGSGRAGAASLASALLALTGCGAEGGGDPAGGTATGSFDCEIYVPGSDPPNVGDGAVVITRAGGSRTIAQGASAFAIDANGQQTFDPDEVSFYAVQIHQFVSETRLEVVEIQIAPEAWIDGGSAAIVPSPPEDDRAALLVAEITFDANGIPVEIEREAEGVGGTVTIEKAGTELGSAVRGRFSATIR